MAIPARSYRRGYRSPLLEWHGGWPKAQEVAAQDKASDGRNERGRQRCRGRPPRVGGWLSTQKSAGAELIYAIHELVSGKAFVAPTVPQPLEPEFKHPGVQSDKILTRRQREVLQLLAGGLTMKETATTLKLTPRTIAFHKYKIIQDFGLHNNLDLLKLAIREHLVTPE